MKQKLNLTSLFLIGVTTAAVLSGCGGGSSPILAPAQAIVPPPTPSSNNEAPYSPAEGVFRDTFQSNFKVGAALFSQQVTQAGDDRDVVASQFNSIGAEFEMKADFIAPQEGIYNFEAADALVQYAEDNGMDIRFHALLWHESTPDYFYEGTPAEVRARLEDYITTVVTRYRGRIKYWDVVNEVVTEDRDATNPYRQSQWLAAAGGPDYIDWAFEAARAADPDAILYINDYGSEFPQKRAQYIQIIQDLKDRDIPLDGVGHQFHLNYETDAVEALNSIDAVDGLFEGLANQITELDISVYNDPGECWQSGTNCDADYGDDLPSSVDATQARLVKALFEGFVARPSVDLVHFWGISDDQSWLNNSPITRTNYPLLFDRDHNPKTWFRAITETDYVIED